MTTNCPQCNKEHNTEHINKELGIITCTNCQTVFSAPYFFDPSNPSKPENKPISIPLGYTRYKSTHRLKINFQGNIQKIIGGLLILIHTSFICAYMLFVTENSELEQALGIWGLYPLIAVIIGIILTRTPKEILVEDNNLRLLYLPKIFPMTTMSVDIDTIKQVYIKEVTKKNKKPSYTVHILQNNGNEKKLIANLKLRSEALYIEQEIESYLGLRDQAVDGEFR
ncbi:MAG: hypothetical protein Phog2KO_10710 [Phototrophicaceae bacterium]